MAPIGQLNSFRPTITWYLIEFWIRLNLIESNWIWPVWRALVTTAYAAFTTRPAGSGVNTVDQQPCQPAGFYEWLSHRRFWQTWRNIAMEIEQTGHVMVSSVPGRPQPPMLTNTPITRSSMILCGIKWIVEQPNTFTPRSWSRFHGLTSTPVDSSTSHYGISVCNSRFIETERKEVRLAMAALNSGFSHIPLI